MGANYSRPFQQLPYLSHRSSSFDCYISLHSLRRWRNFCVAMVVVLGSGKFYGSSLPRPRFYAHGDERVDPPVPISDPLLVWANEAHWSMGGLSFHRHRHRLQGRIEGSVKRLRAQREEIQQRRTISPPTISESPSQNGGAEMAN
ncbi:hypothetical protein ZIOFF_025754 [Zingiber officinale]|uniref:Uncharacterized protein n=1 Tax=Zingiber officinale TaxID=94328 RepID=A0A8J5LJZ8_ZINOF|nr:hypothetical protein ZIOFF_025754 [Zingiber officinale]